MTLLKTDHLHKFGVDLIGCIDCDPFQGDTNCDTELPVLCKRTDKSPRPAYFILYPIAENILYGWTMGHSTTTLPVAASKFKNIEAVDKFCTKSFG
jgi:hypothetical protein